MAGGVHGKAGCQPRLPEASRARPRSAATASSSTGALRSLSRPGTAQLFGLGAANRRPPSGSHSTPALLRKPDACTPSTSSASRKASSCLGQPSTRAETPASRPSSAMPCISKLRRGAEPCEENAAEDRAALSRVESNQQLQKHESKRSLAPRPRSAAASSQSLQRARANLEASLEKITREGGLSGQLPSPSATIEILSSSVHQCTGEEECPPPLTAGLYPTTVSENLKAQDSADAIERSQQQTKAEVRRKSGGSTVAEFLMLAADTQNLDQDLRDVEGQLAEMGRNIRMENYVLEDQAKKLSAEEERRRAEQHRRQAEKERRLRQQAKDSQRPRTRVEAQLERCRLFGGLPAKSKVPMRTRKMQAGLDTHAVTLVDVDCLQNKCLGFDKGSCSSYAKAREAKERQEARKQWEARAFPDGPREDYVLSGIQACNDTTMNRSRSVMNSRMQQQERRREARQKKADQRRRRIAHEKCEQKLSAFGNAWDFENLTCCNEESEVALKRLLKSRPHGDEDEKADHLDGHAGTDTEESDNGNSDEDVTHEVPMVVVHTATAADATYRKAQKQMPHSLKPAGHGNRSRSASILLCSRSSSRVNSQRFTPTSLKVFTPAKSDASKGSLLDSAALEAQKVREASARAIFRWGVLRSVFCSVWLLRLIRRRNRSVDIMKSLLESIAKVNKARHAAHGIKERVRRIQSLYRAFRLRRDRWCDRMLPKWVRIEDYHIANYFKAQEQLNARCDDADRLPPRVPWQEFKIPMRERRRALARWYVAQIRRAAQAHKGLQIRAEQAKTQHRDLQRFLDLCGQTDVDASMYTKRPPEVPKPEPVRSIVSSFGERDVLALIAWSARELAERGQSPFQHHPAARASPSTLAVSHGGVKDAGGERGVGRAGKKTMKFGPGTSNGTTDRSGKVLPAWLIPQRYDGMAGGSDGASGGFSASSAEAISLDDTGSGGGGRSGSKGVSVLTGTSDKSALGGAGEQSRNAPKKEHINVDDLFRRFTPRLREINRVGMTRDHVA